MHKQFANKAVIHNLIISDCKAILVEIHYIAKSIDIVCPTDMWEVLKTERSCGNCWKVSRLFWVLLTYQ